MKESTEGSLKAKGNSGSRPSSPRFHLARIKTRLQTAAWFTQTAESHEVGDTNKDTSTWEKKAGKPKVIKGQES